MNAMEQEKKVLWKNGSLVTEGRLLAAKGDRGVIICHPHPQMGGSMHNNVVETVRDVFGGLQYATLRFNFRGVGESTGRFDEGRGEAQDVLSAISYVREQGITRISLVGYSFGAWVCCRLLKSHVGNFEAVILVSPPDKFFPFDWDGLEGKVNFIVNGNLDPFCDPDHVKKQALQIGARHMVLEDTDHFYVGREFQLAESLRQFLKQLHS